MTRSTFEVQANGSGYFLSQVLPVSLVICPRDVKHFEQVTHT